MQGVLRSLYTSHILHSYLAIIEVAGDVRDLLGGGRGDPEVLPDVS